jgi:diguanylate cyclase (GGDEF)-like protein
LTISLVAVSVLAGTANMIARESVHIIRTVSHSAAAAHPPPLFDAQSLARASIAETKKTDALALAVERFRQGSLAHVEQEPSGRSEFVDAKAALQLATLEYAGGPPTVFTRSTPGKAELGDYLERGETLRLLAEQRRQLRTAYTRHAASIADGLQKSLSSAWTIFGRVIARQSLVQMRDALDSLRQHAEPLLSDNVRAGTDLTSLAADELQFSNLLKSSGAGLASSQGEEWVRAIRKDFDALVALRPALATLNLHYEQASKQFSQRSRTVLNEISAASASPASTPRQPIQIALSQEPPRAHPPAAPALPQLGDSITETTVERSDAESARLMALVTTLVMLTIVAVSFFTIRSILVPVRRLVNAAKEIANGPANVRVPRGGMRELDVVACSFNDMALRLEAAQTSYKEQQESLEEQVLQRTRKLRELAEQDPLTGLPNRRHLAELLNSALVRAQRDDSHVGVYFLDIDNFKNINDSLGHAFGDRVLMSVADRLRKLAEGFGFVARLGGDEFTVVYENAASIDAVQELGWTLARAFHKLVSVDQRELSISVSVGASIYPDHESDAQGLLRAADAALFQAKELGRSQLAIFTPELTTTAAARFDIEQGLRRALERTEFVLHYQPEIDPATSKIVLVEALLRWRYPSGRLATPGEFLAVAEQSGLISEVNNWVLRAALDDAARWYRGDWPEVRVAINISARQLLDHRFIERVLAMLKEFRLPAKCIELELTEMVLQTGPATIAALHELRAHGFGVALDDFGTGYSSLTSLEQLPLSRIKLDRSLVARIDTSARSAAIARAIIDLCAELGLQVTAEGIERLEQFAWFLGKPGIVLQGFLLSEAVPFLDIGPLSAMLSGKVQDLVLSMPVRNRPAAAVKPKFASGG